MNLEKIRLHPVMVAGDGLDPDYLIPKSVLRPHIFNYGGKIPFFSNPYKVGSVFDLMKSCVLDRDDQNIITSEHGLENDVAIDCVYMSVQKPHQLTPTIFSLRPENKNLVVFKQRTDGSTSTSKWLDEQNVVYVGNFPISENQYVQIRVALTMHGAINADTLETTVQFISPYPLLVEVKPTIFTGIDRRLVSEWSEIDSLITNGEVIGYELEAYASKLITVETFIRPQMELKTLFQDAMRARQESFDDLCAGKGDPTIWPELYEYGLQKDILVWTKNFVYFLVAYPDKGIFQVHSVPRNP